MGKSEVLCDCDVIHDDVVAAVRQEMPSDGKITELAEFFKVFGDSTRIRILWALDHAELCVCDIAVLLNMTKSAISHQLRVLRDSKLVNRKSLTKPWSILKNRRGGMFDEKDLQAGRTGLRKLRGKNGSSHPEAGRRAERDDQLYDPKVDAGGERRGF